MHSKDLKILLSNFNITQQELESRRTFNEFAYSFASIIVDEFVQKYLITNPNLLVYLAHIDQQRLVKNIKDFVAFTLTAPIDEDYVVRIHRVGFTHFSIKLEPSKVSYGFFAISEILNSLSEVNDIVKEHRTLISKIFRFVEYVMNDGYYIQKEKEYQKSLEKLQGLSIENELYIGLNKHKLNFEKIQKAVLDDKDKYLLDEIENLSCNCDLGKLLASIKSQKYKHALDLDVDKLIKLHDSWHSELVDFKDSLVQNSVENINTKVDKISNITIQISTLLEKALKKSLDDGKVALESSVRSMKYMTDILSIKKCSVDFYDTLEELTKEIFSEFSWALDDIKIVFDIENIDETFNIKKIIRYDSQNAILGIRLKNEYKFSYIEDMIKMLLEVLELHFTIQDRESSLVAFADKAESANRAKDMFLANMSHELRTPLNAVNGFSQILMKKKDVPDTVRTYISKINIAGSNLLDLVNTILDFAKLEAGKMQFNPKLSNISKILSEVNTLVEPMALKKNIDFHMAKIVSLNLYIDEKLFKQVLVNLLSNAIKFTTNSGKVELSIEFNYERHVYIFKVKDNGIGISKEGILKLFKPFTQVDDSYKKQDQGTGLGLMISKKIVEDLHKGKIWVESEIGKGSSFYVELPTPPIESSTYEVKEASVDAKNILIADDSKYYQKILIENLKQTHNMTVTDSVNKVKKLIKENKYDFLILDFFLIDGVSSEILMFMEDEDISIPSIVISAEDEIHISSTLAGSSNLEGIMNKDNIETICKLLKGGGR